MWLIAAAHNKWLHVIETGIQLMQQVVNGQGIIVHGRTLMG